MSRKRRAGKSTAEIASEAPKRESAYIEFRDRFVGRGHVGVITGSDWTPVRLGPIVHARNADEKRRIEYGCTTKQAILVTFFPIAPKAAGPQSDWKLFPKEFRGLRIYYRRGYVAKALRVVP